MLIVHIFNDAPDHWVPAIERSFHMTLAHLESAIESVHVEFTVPPPSDAHRSFLCQLLGTTALGRQFRIDSRHDDPDQVITHTFARARRELGRELLRPPLRRASATGARCPPD